MDTIAQVLDPGGQSIDRVLPPPLVKIVGPQLKQLPLSSRRNPLPVKRINWTLLMGHEYVARALVELMQIGKTPSRANAVLHHPPEAFNGVEMVPTVGHCGRRP